MSHTVKSREVAHIAVADIKAAPYNPKGRTEAQKLKALQKSIERLGLLYPLLVDDKGNLIDGHRRLACAKALAWKTTPCLVVSGDRDDIYASVNATSSKLSGNDALGVWLKNPKAVTPYKATQFEKAEEVVGRHGLDMLFKGGLSIRVFLTAKKIARYCDTPDKVPEITRWLQQHGQIGAVMKAVDNDYSPQVIAKAITANRPIKFQIEVA